MDNATDVKIADTAAEQKAFGYAYARGILKTAGIADKGMYGGTSGSGTSGSYLVKVTIKDLYIRKGSWKELCKQGIHKARRLYHRRNPGQLGQAEVWRRLDLSGLRKENIGVRNGLGTTISYRRRHCPCG